jgi:hypothetical protein
MRADPDPASWPAHYRSNVRGETAGSTLSSYRCLLQEIIAAVIDQTDIQFHEGTDVAVADFLAGRGGRDLDEVRAWLKREQDAYFARFIAARREAAG